MYQIDKQFKYSNERYFIMTEEKKKLITLVGLWRDYRRMTPDRQEIFRAAAPDSIMDVFSIMDGMMAN